MPISINALNDYIQIITLRYTSLMCNVYNLKHDVGRFPIQEINLVRGGESIFTVLKRPNEVLKSYLSFLPNSANALL